MQGTDQALYLVSQQNIFYWMIFNYVAPLVFKFLQPRKFLRMLAQLTISYKKNKAILECGDRLPWIRIATGGDIFDLLTQKNLLLLHLSNEVNLFTFTYLQQIVLIDNKFYRPNLILEKIPVYPIERKELQCLYGAKRILVRPDGYIAAIDWKVSDQKCMIFLNSLKFEE